MQLSKRTQYGLRAMICLGDAYQRGYLQTKELAARENLPTKFLESILSALTRAKFLSSKIGATGGYRLSRDPKQLSMADIIARLEGNKLLEDEDVETGGRPGEMAVEIVQGDLSAAVRDVLEKMSLSDLMERVSQSSRGNQMYYI
jgi:Rrf2 family cysteine metabolism transcriptional repressor